MPNDLLVAMGSREQEGVNVNNHWKNGGDLISRIRSLVDAICRTIYVVLDKNRFHGLR